MRRVLFNLVLVLAAGAFGGTNGVAWRVPSYTLTARSMSVRQALETFGVAEGVPVVMSDAVEGTFSGVFDKVPAAEFLDRLATAHNLVWYYDGASVYVYASGETVSILQDLAYMKADEVLRMLRELGVEDGRFPIKATQNGELIMVSGPPRYVQLVAETIRRADRLKESRTFNEIEVRLFPLLHTWADNTSFSVTTTETTVPIKGVAYLLEEIMRAGGGDKTRDGTNELDKADMLRTERAMRVQPVIRPENRLNAVMVRDVSTRMPMYERLIRQLDRPQRLVEIGVTVIELSKQDALDWQLSLSVRGTKDEHDGAVGMNAQNLMETAALSGMGLAGAYSYLGENTTVNASLATLKQKGKLRNVERTSIVTFNNLAASLSDTRTYQARVVGEKVASLEHVSAGTRLSVKPRIVETPQGATNEARRIWLSMELRDGGFEAVAVDNMPMTSETTLQTQASVSEGDSLLLAGYFRDIKQDAGWGIPYLRDIPWIGWLFGGLSKVDETVQRLFILTPHVVEIAGPADEDDVVRRTLRQRDLTDVEKLVEDVEGNDDERRIREQDAEERRAIRHEGAERTLERRAAEIERDARIRERSDREFRDRLEADRAIWERDFHAAEGDGK